MLPQLHLGDDWHPSSTGSSCEGQAQAQLQGQGSELGPAGEALPLLVVLVQAQAALVTLTQLC